MPTTEITHALLAPGEGELIEVAGNRILIIVANPPLLVCDYSAAPHFPGPPLHVHPGFDETYLVLEGRLEVTVAEERRELPPSAAA
ncbi:MAG: cupin domain-containing protein [Solirubrobacterales bacterium]|nr:cupin domain-containing protein [Solirubrobacterales bacterium]